MDPTSQGGLTRAGLTFDEHRCQMGLHPSIGSEDPFDLNLETGQSVPEKVAGAFSALLLGHASTCLGGPGTAKGQGQRLRLEGLGEVIKSAQSDGLHRPRNPALGRHDHHARVSRDGLIAKQVRPQAIGQVHVHQGEIEIRRAQRLASPGHRVGGGDLSAPTLQTGDQMPPPEGFIFEDQNRKTREHLGRHGAHQSSKAPRSPSMKRPIFWSSLKTRSDRTVAT